jgi:hypothetical protein
VFDELYRQFDRIGGTHLDVFDEIDHLEDSNTLLYELPRARKNGHTIPHCIECSMPVTFALKQDTVDGLQARVSELTDRIEAYRDQYDADSPAAVDVLEFDAEQVDDVYVDLGDWATAIEERRFHERARREVAGSTAPSHG